MKKVIGIAIFCLASFLLSMSTAHTEEGKTVSPDWEKKYTYRYDYKDRGPVTVKLLSAQVKEGKLILDILIHNKDKYTYSCVWFNTSNDAVHIDDE